MRLRVRQKKTKLRERKRVHERRKWNRKWERESGIRKDDFGGR